MQPRLRSGAEPPAAASALMTDSAPMRRASASWRHASSSSGVMR